MDIMIPLGIAIGNDRSETFQFDLTVLHILLNVNALCSYFISML